MKNKFRKIALTVFLCCLVLLPSINYAAKVQNPNIPQIIEPNAPIKVNVQSYHLNQHDSWVRPYIITTKGHIGKWDIAGYTYYKVGSKTGAEYYHTSGVILPIYTEYWGHKHIIHYISGWDYTGKIWTKLDGSKGPYELYEIHMKYNSQKGQETTIKKIT